ncbi:hypothetical protein PO587_02765 [Streptomyces gilvifuscus]|uniref:Uncharacterized protein n=1 Tax=Streptomyces gilvifuscus TaxID=1550617 RepID=A0ABT5FLI9_9ACTN|nr:hypothetical protein [Streptomyces gilvifuscus]MDC2953373.1 hypothetical protein [Streptomyces gilvifuscus]
MDLLRDLWANKELMSALLGSVVGGIVTFLVAMYQAKKSLEALRLQGADARDLAERERKAVAARDAAMRIMDLLLDHRSGLREHGTEQDWVDDQEAVLDRIRSYARVLPVGEHRQLLLTTLKDLARRRPTSYHRVAFKNDKVKVANAALVVIGAYLNEETVQPSTLLDDIRTEWDKVAEEEHLQMIAAMDTEPQPDDWDDDSSTSQSTPSASP